MKLTRICVIGLVVAMAWANLAISQEHSRQPMPPVSRPKMPGLGANKVRIENDVAYLGPERQEKGDLYRPAMSTGTGRFPAVLIIHGGGWSGGDKRAAREVNIGTTLALHGYVGFSINYVLAAKGHPTWPQNLYDCKTAVRWLRKNASG